MAPHFIKGGSNIGARSAVRVSKLETGTWFDTTHKLVQFPSLSVPDMGNALQVSVRIFEDH
jgi:hypothetical protein